MDNTPLKPKNLESPEAISQIFERRKKIINRNNICVIDTVATYEDIALKHIIFPYFFNENAKGSKKFNKFLNERMTFNDRYVIMSEIAQEKNVEKLTQNKFEKLIELRNGVAHVVSRVESYHSKRNTFYLTCGGVGMEWCEYLSKLDEWSKISFEMAKYLKKFFVEKIVPDIQGAMFFPYCKLAKYVLWQHVLRYPKPAEEYQSLGYFRLDSDVLLYIKEENDLDQYFNCKS